MADPTDANIAAYHDRMAEPTRLELAEQAQFMSDGVSGNFGGHESLRQDNWFNQVAAALRRADEEMARLKGELLEIDRIVGRNIAHKSTKIAVADLKDDFIRIHHEKCDNWEAARKAEAALAQMRRMVEVPTDEEIEAMAREIYGDQREKVFDWEHALVEQVRDEFRVLAKSAFSAFARHLNATEGK